MVAPGCREHRTFDAIGVLRQQPTDFAKSPRTTLKLIRGSDVPAPLQIDGTKRTICSDPWEFGIDPQTPFDPGEIRGSVAKVIHGPEM
jgi:hypothetical protein